MQAKYPIWLVLPGEEGPGKHKLESYSDDPTYGPDEGMLLIPLTVLGSDIELSVCDSDERYKGGWIGPMGTLWPADRNHPHWDECSFPCDHVTDAPCHYQKTDAGWWLVCKVIKGCEVWVYETDVPIDNHPRSENVVFGNRAHRRPPRSN